MRLLAAIFLVSTLAPGPATAQKKNTAKPPAIETLELTARREDGKVVLDGKVKNCGVKPIRKLAIYFDFVSAESAVLSTKRGGVDEEVLDVGAEAEFHVQVEDTPRATAVRGRFEDSDGRDLREARPVAVSIE